ALALVDESVYYIQSDYAGDPRQFYFVNKRPHQVQTGSTMNQKSYAKLVEWENEQLIDERDKQRYEHEKERRQAGREEAENVYLKDSLDEFAAYDAQGGGGGGGGGGGRNRFLGRQDATMLEAKSVSTYSLMAPAPASAAPAGAMRMKAAMAGEAQKKDASGIPMPEPEA